MSSLTLKLDTLSSRVYIVIMTREFIITKEFDRTWKELGLNDDDLRELEIYLCKNPDCGDTLEGTGGIKKFRWALEKLSEDKYALQKLCPNI